jgi:hypothetical protein
VKAWLALAGRAFAALCNDPSQLSKLLAALQADIASKLHVAADAVSITSVTVTVGGVEVEFRVTVASAAEGDEVRSSASELSSEGSSLPATAQVYSSATGASDVQVSQSEADGASSVSGAVSASVAAAALAVGCLAVAFAA